MYRTVVFHRALKKKEKLTTTPQQQLSDTDKKHSETFPTSEAEISSEEISAIVLLVS